MDDLTGMIQQVLGDPESMKQLQAVASSLGLTGDVAEQTAKQELNPPKESAVPPSEGPDLNALSSFLQSLAGGSNTASDHVDALTTLLGAYPPQSTPDQGVGLPFDMDTLRKLQKAMSTIGSNRSNIALLLALKPRLKPARAKKVDDAVRVMQLIQLMPLLKESGLFGEKGDGLGSLVSGLGDGIQNAIGGLFGSPGARR